MRESLGLQIDYVIFTLVCASTLAAITVWLQWTQRSRPTLIIPWIALPLLLIPGWFLVNSAGDLERDLLKRRIQGLAPTYAEELRLMGHDAISLQTPADDPLYLAMIAKQIRWLEINEAVADIYTFRQHPDGNQLIVDSETDYDHNGVYEGDRESRTEVGEIWDEKNVAIERAYSGQAAFDDEIYTDRWGTWVSAYVPMLDDDGNVDAVLGVDFPAEDWIAEINRTRLLAIGFLSVVFTIGLASASIIVVLRANLSERERAARDLLVAKEVAEAATKSKSEFLANMSHEIRTPMNGIIGMTDLLSGTQLNQQQDEYLRLVRQSADSLLGLLNDILDFSKIEAGKLELESIQFNLRDSIERTVQPLSFRAGQKGLELCCRIDPNVPNELIGDPGRLSQVVVNLAGNAIKFTEQGEIVIDVRQESRGNDDVALICSVRDTGIGIAQDKLKSIFTAFSQEDASTTRRFGGTGLGLAICAQLVKMMGGRIWVESEKDVGTTFSFTGKFLLSSTEPESRETAILQGVPILVVDDNETNRFILDEILKRWNMKPVLVDSGAAALLEMKRTADDLRPFGLALIDCMMPNMDGFQLAQSILSDPKLQGCRLVMISSAAVSDDLSRCRELGVARYMTKPVVQSELLRTLLDLVGAATAKHSDKPVGDQPSDPYSLPLRILLAEDGVVNQKVATGFLKKHHHQVVIANNGREATELFQREPFDLVLMDVQMPEMDGMEATAAIRQYEDGKQHTPIIAMTASAMKGDRERCLAAGMDGYLAKPIHSKELYETISRFSPAVSVTTDNTRVVELPGITDQLSIVDLHAAVENSPEGYQGLRYMAPLLQRECDEMLSIIRAGLADGDAKEVRRAAHTIKGSASVFAAQSVVDKALQLEQLATDERLEQAKPVFAELAELAKQLKSELILLDGS